MTGDRGWRFQSCVPLFNKFGVMPLPCIYIAECSLFVKKHSNLFDKNSDFHSYNTRSCSNFRNAPHKKAMYEKSPKYRFTHIFNALPLYIKNIQKIDSFKKELTKYLMSKNYYCINDYLTG